MPSALHVDLKAAAKQEGMSLNQYCLYLLSRHTPKSQAAQSQRAEELLKFVVQAQKFQKELNPISMRYRKAVPEISLKRRLKKLSGKN